VGEIVVMVMRGGQTAAPSSTARGVGVAVENGVVRLRGQSYVVADPAMSALYAAVAEIAWTDAPVLILGETGSGKEVVAEAVHAFSQRWRRPLMAISCAALPEPLADGELFGFESGAGRTGPGLLENAGGGTVLLDEIDALGDGAQAGLARLLESKTVVRVGSTRERSVDVRLVVTSDQPLSGRLRPDLLERLAAATVRVPPLRERPLEISHLARHFLEQACRRLGREPLGLSAHAVLALGAHAWPGNVRELRNLMTSLAATVDGPTVVPWHLARLREP
jgi:two-component system response regulator AtoC